MHFTNLSAALLGLAALASAVPHQLEAGNVERGLTWTPRSLMERGVGKDGDKGGNKDVLKIIDTTIVKLDEKSKDSEVELTLLVEEKIRKEGDKKKAKDNLRKNHFKNKNKDVNTVIIVITEILDIRDSSKQDKRYLRHQLRADNKQKQDVTIQITEVVAITISNDDKGGKKGKGKDSQTKTHGDEKDSQTKTHGDDKSGKGSGATAASDAVAAAIQTLDPNAPYASNNQTLLLPSGAAAPSAAQTGSDPAAIVEDSPAASGLYVQGTT